MTTPCRHEPELVAGKPVVYREETWMPFVSGGGNDADWIVLDEHHECRHCGERMEIPTERPTQPEATT